MTITRIGILLFMSIGFILVACNNGKTEKNQLNVEDYANIFSEHEQIFQGVANGILISGKEGKITYNKSIVHFENELFTEVFTQNDADELHHNIIEIFELGIIGDIKCNNNSIEFEIIYSDSDVTFEYHYSRDVKLTAHIVRTLDEDESWSLVFIPHV